MYFYRGKHVFEGFCVPDFVCRYWVGEGERWLEQKKKAGAEGRKEK